jgi:prepilin-type N-terminal cleavage/methylation domain-containing protein
MNQFRNGKSMVYPRNGRAAAFTLIELLVVVSIIALLISILLPSLKSAREQAKTAVCSSMQAGLGRGMATYQAEWVGWMCGAPATSGSIMFGQTPAPAPNAQNTQGTPVQIWDWAGPTKAFKHEDPQRGMRWKNIAETFKCPSNTILSQPYLGGSIGPMPGWPVQPLMSYNTMRQFMLWPRPTIGEPDPIKNIPGAGNLGNFSQIGGLTNTPANYKPLADALQNPSEKVALSDSSRFTTDEGKFDHDIAWNGTAGGGFSDGGPTLKSVPGSTDFLRAFRLEKNLAPATYRHKKGKDLGVVVLFFDGSAKWMSERISRYPDPWWPKGTTIPPADLNLPALQSVAGRLYSGVYTVAR